MTTKLYSIFSGIILMAGVGIANAAPVRLSGDQLDAISAGRVVLITAGASASGFIAAAQAGTLATNIGGSGYAVAMGNTGASAHTSGYAAGSSIAITNTASGTMGPFVYSVTTVAVH